MGGHPAAAPALRGARAGFSGRTAALAQGCGQTAAPARAGREKREEKKGAKGRGGRGGGREVVPF